MPTVRSLAADGYTRGEVAAELGLTPGRVRRLAARQGVRFKPGGRPDPFLRLRVMDLIREGERSAAHVARRMGRNRTLVNRWVRDLIARGLLRRTGRGPKTRLYLTEAWTGGG